MSEKINVADFERDLDATLFYEILQSDFKGETKFDLEIKINGENIDLSRLTDWVMGNIEFFSDTKLAETLKHSPTAQRIKEMDGDIEALEEKISSEFDVAFPYRCISEWATEQMEIERKIAGFLDDRNSAEYNSLIEMFR
ncbi:hypothetical protein N9043_00840 [bacterium]|nr:hypothetical protein [bacterium]